MLINDKNYQASDKSSIVLQFLPILMVVSYHFFSRTLSNCSLGGCGGISLVHIPKMCNKKCFKIYGMIYLAFQSLLLKLMAYIISGVVNQWVRPPLNPAITLKIIIF